MDSPADLFGGLPPQLCVFGSYPSPAAPPSGARPPPGPARPPYPLIHHLLQPSDSAPRRAGGALPHDGFLGQGEEDGGGWDEEEEGREGGGPGGQVRGKRRGGAALVASWRRDVMTVKRLRLGRGGEEEEGEEEERGRRERGREGRRREREELKEQLEEARGRLQALQERVWKAFGETQPPEEERRKRRGGGEEEEEGEDMAERIYEEEEEEEGGADELSLSLVPSPPLQESRREERRVDGGERMDRGGGGEGGEGGGGGLFLKSVLERAGLWMGCGLVRGEWEGEGGGGEGEEGGQKFAQALKLELGGAVTRVIDRVLRLYTHTHTLSPSPPSPTLDMHSLRGERGSEGGGGVWAGRREGGEKGERGETDHALGPSHAPPHPNQSRREQSEALPLVTRRLPPPSHSDRPHLLPPHPSLSRLPPPRHPHPLLPPRSKESFLSHSYPPGPPPLPLPLPLLHYTMQQLFGRSLPPLPPLQKDLLTSDPYLDFPSSSYPPVPLLGHLDPALPHLHQDREREGGMRGGGGGEGGEMYLAGGASQDGLSPCHLKKAKLMFFYARYPSSNTLKTYFPDVKFNRCVTSQLIKWFSNFREFFYIQMERFARQAVRDRVPREGAPGLGREGREGPGLGRDPQVRLGRDTELYRILNMHYNKSNDYQVPDRFVEVAEIALREFFTAILSGRDSDPCWKKSIYKIICKLDGPVPDSFKLPGCPVA